MCVQYIVVGEEVSRGLKKALFAKYYHGDQTRNYKMDGHVARMRKINN
jgi:hypothetical protein